MERKKSKKKKKRTEKEKEKKERKKEKVRMLEFRGKISEFIDAIVDPNHKNIERLKPLERA